MQTTKKGSSTWHSQPRGAPNLSPQEMARSGSEDQKPGSKRRAHFSWSPGLRLFSLCMHLEQVGHEISTREEQSILQCNRDGFMAKESLTIDLTENLRTMTTHTQGVAVWWLFAELCRRKATLGQNRSKLARMREI